MITRQEIIDIFEAIRDSSAKEYQWLSTDGEPTPAASERAYGVEIDVATDEMTVKYWNGGAWVDLA